MIPCAMDPSATAALCCMCKFPPVPICHAHLSDHALHPENSTHFPLPLSARDWLSVKKVYYQCKDWLSHLQNAYREAANNVESMQRCRSDLNEKFAAQPKLVFLLTRDRVDKLASAFQAELQAAIDATSAHAVEDFQFEEGSLSSLIRTAAIQTDYDALELFTYQQEVPSFEIRLASLAAFNQPLNIDPGLESVFWCMQEKVDFLTQENAQLRTQNRAEVESLQLEIQQLTDWNQTALQGESRLRAEYENLKVENAKLKEAEEKWHRRVRELEAEALIRKAPGDLGEGSRTSPSLSLSKAGGPAQIPAFLTRLIPGPAREIPLGKLEESARLLPAQTEVEKSPNVIASSSEPALPPPSSIPCLPYVKVQVLPIESSRDFPNCPLLSSSTNSLKCEEMSFPASADSALLTCDARAPAQYGELYIRDALGVMHTLDYSPAFTVENLKYKLASLCHIPVDQQILSYGSLELEDTHTLVHYGVEQKAELSLSKRSARLCKSFYVQSTTDLFTYDYKPHLKLGEVKRLIEANYAIPVDIMTLKSGERVLDDECSLKHYNLQRGCTIHLSVEARLFTVRIRPPQGQVFSIQGSYLTTVREAKEMVEAKLRLPREMQQLLRETHVLEDAQSFVNAKVKANMTLELKYKPIQLVVRLENDQDVTIPCTYNTPIKEIKQSLAGYCPVDLQRLTYAEEELNEEKTVGDCELVPNSVLRLYQGCKNRQEIQVRLASGRTTVLEYDPKALVGQVRDAALQKLGADLGKYQVQHAGLVLEEQSTLASEYVQRGSTLYLTAK